MRGTAGSPQGLLNVFVLAHEALLCSEPGEKVRLTQQLAVAFAAGDLDCAPVGLPAVQPVPVPGRPPRPKLVLPRDVAQRKLSTPEGRAALVHAVAHIEFNAINLALDAVYRFRQLPREFLADWLGVAADEARHFVLLDDRLAQLGHAYGDFDAHNGLWEMALKTADDPLLRMALVPRVLEARGLDVTPAMIQRLLAVGDRETVAILRVILSEEVAHVAVGTRWFGWLCQQRGLQPDATFLSLIHAHAAGAIRGPYNRDARREAGFSAVEMAGIDEIASAAAARRAAAS